MLKKKTDCALFGKLDGAQGADIWPRCRSRYTLTTQMGRPQIRFPLSRGFAVSGLSLGVVTQGGVLKDLHLPWAIFGRPYRGFRFAASLTVENCPAIICDDGGLLRS